MATREGSASTFAKEEEESGGGVSDARFAAINADHDHPWRRAEGRHGDGAVGRVRSPVVNADVVTFHGGSSVAAPPYLHRLLPLPSAQRCPCFLHRHRIWTRS
ncbi:hypothetical protein ZWY2020_047996 [Hordeum vulgare]|nr:hypothetical protein ZWY2020_047996 [Hordeum vulgare]